jgi:hypothetical protein
MESINTFETSGSINPSTQRSDSEDVVRQYGKEGFVADETFRILVIISGYSAGCPA